MGYFTFRSDTFHVEADLSPDAPTVVFIHPLGADLRVFAEVATAVGHAGLGVLRYDLRGHGLSDLGEPPREIGDHAVDLAAILDAFEVKRACVCGVSVGGMIALDLWRRRPGLVDRLVLACTGAKIGTAEAWNLRIAAVEAGGVAALTESILQRWFPADEYAKGVGNVALARNMLNRTSSAGYAATCVCLRDSDLTEAAKTVNVPCLCIAGEFDGSTPPDFVHALSEQIPGASFVVIPGAGHVAPLQRPEAFAREVLGFVRR